MNGDGRVRWVSDEAQTEILNRMEARGVMTPMPNAPRTPLKSFRIPEDLYRETQQIAADEGISVSDVVRKALERYVKAGRRKRAHGGDA